MDNIADILAKNFPKILDTDLVKGIIGNGKLESIDEGDYLIDIGSPIRTIPMIVSGSVKVMREDADGNELLLYYLKAGETCAMSLTCCMEGRKSEIRAVAVDPVQMIALPVALMDEWMRFRDWRSFVMNTYAKRFEELLETIDSIAFQRMDERLENYLITKAKGTESKLLTVSHQEVAQDLNTSREVISRLLKQMEKRGKLKLGRGKIELKGRL
ncbi:MAG: Crp/Fnr family transcriptional regulator [Flavobacteriales bacterium]|nr:Crp/Fnr family transcriptional regulator [Flavobacteriales bacterium]